MKIYRASAGSGKTFTLTTEYIRLMVCGDGNDEFAHTLAVTFTNKATAEMKDRIIEHLYGIWRGVESSGDMLAAVRGALEDGGVHIDTDELRWRCGVALRGILHDYQHFRVETIDSFFQSVMRCLARELGLGCNLQVDLHDAEVSALAVDRLIDRLEEDKGLQSIVMDYIHEQLESEGRWNVQRSIKRFSSQIFGEEFCSRTDGERMAMQDDALARRFRKSMRDIRDESLERMVCLTRGMLDEFQDVPELEEWCGRRQLPAITFMKTVLKGRDGDKARAGKGFMAFLADGASALKKAYAEDARAVAVMRGLGEKFNGYLKVFDLATADCNTAVLALRYAYPLQLLCRIDEEVRVINEENERFPLSKTPTLLSRLVDGQDSPFVFEKIGSVLRNVMIDEFQDTSLLQWNNFRVLLFENQALGGSDMLVGDVKQSIYRWRGGDWSLLRDVTDTMREWSPTDRPLRTNWRSDRNIVEFNNGFFPAAAAMLDGMDAGARFRLADIYEDVVQLVPDNRGDKGFVCLNIYNGSSADKCPKLDRDEILAWRMDGMLERITELHEGGLPLEEMAVIVRYNWQASEILDYFERYAPKDIVLSSDEAFLLENSTLVRLMICVLRMLVTDVERNPVPARQFLLLYYREVVKLPLTTDELMRTETDLLMPGWLREELPRLADMPLFELLGEIYRKLDLQRLNSQDAYHFAFMDCVMDFLRDNPGDVHSFLTAWDEGLGRTPIPSARTSGIRILTLHKSKGLEFHTVFMPFADFNIEKESGLHETILWCEADGLQDANALGKLPIRLSGRMAQSRYADCYAEEHLQRRVDELNALYVAMTRASHNLLMWAVTGNRLDMNSTTGDLLNEVLNPEKCFEDRMFCLERGVPVAVVDGEKEHDNRMAPLPDAHEVAMVCHEPRMDFRLSNEAAEMLTGLRDDDGDDTGHEEDMSQRVLGTICHRILEQVHDWNDVDRVLNISLMNGVLNDEQSVLLRSQLRQIEDDMVVREWFAPENRVFAECEVLDPHDRENSRRRPDRVVMRGDVITVIDYKFGEVHGGYRGQVKRYMRLLRRLYPRKRVCGFLWYVKNAKIEEVVL